jgi:hypothetical protein
MTFYIPIVVLLNRHAYKVIKRIIAALILGKLL